MPMTHPSAHPPILLAPMEGLLDHSLRDVLTRVGGVTRCVSEFIRVTDTLLPERAFLRVVPELANGGRTAAGVPVRAQLLGSDAACLADNAARVVALGSPGVDLNFGCPAKVVNRHGGGAALLDDPELLTRIVAAVRRAVPADVPVSAKMRLGTASDARAIECAQALVAGGAGELVVHARTKAQGYQPPAYWQRVAEVAAAVAVPVVANGEIWTVADARRCQAESGCAALMLGRGMVADPGLARALRGGDALTTAACGPTLPWAEVLPLLTRYWLRVQLHVGPRHQCGRIKQWLNYLRRAHPEAEATYQRLRTLNCPDAMGAALGALTAPSGVTGQHLADVRAKGLAHLAIALGREVDLVDPVT